MVDITLTLLGGNGDTITFDESNFIVTDGLMGFGIAPTDVRLQNSAGDGSLWRSTRRKTRTIDVPVYVLGDSRQDVESKLRRLSNALSDRYGTPKLMATYSDGSAYDIEIHYTGGSETTFGADAGTYHCRWVLSLSCPEPYWTSVNAISFSLSADTSTKNLLPELDRLLVQSSQIVGDTTINNPGDVDAYPVWQIEGPSSNVAITLSGSGFQYTETLVAENVITIDTKTAIVTNSAGVNKYAYLGSAPKLFSLPPGSSNVSITVTGTTSASKISCYYKPRREVIF